MNAHTDEDLPVRTVGWTMGAVLSGSFPLAHHTPDLHWALSLVCLAFAAFCAVRLVLMVCFPHVDLRPLIWVMGAIFWLVSCFGSDVVSGCRRVRTWLSGACTTCYLVSILAPLAVLAPFAFLRLTKEERRERSYDDRDW